MSGSHRTNDEIVGEIQLHHNNGEPLNISDIKRNHPALIEDVFALSPFLGWKRALEAAGLSYDRIRFRLSSQVKCLVCGKNYIMVTNHAIHAHQISKDEYARKFPGAETLSDQYRKRMSSFQEQKVFPHWEPFWTPEYIHDRLFHLFEMGVPKNLESIVVVDGGLANAIMDHKDALGTWLEILEKLGVEPETDLKDKRATEFSTDYKKRHRHVKYTTPRSVITGIRLRRREKLPLNSTGIQKGKDVDRSLHTAAIRCFGTWEKALAKAGVDPESVRIYEQRFYSDGDVTKAILDRNRAGLPSNARAVDRSDAGLYVQAVKRFGSWDGALDAAGLDSSRIRKRTPKYVTKEEVIAEIRRMHANGDLLYFAAVRRANNSLVNRGRRLFGGWSEVLVASGISPEEVAFQRNPAK